MAQRKTPALLGWRSPYCRGQANVTTSLCAIRAPGRLAAAWLAGRTGVVFFKDCWSRTNETFEGRSGDHIDLRSKNGITRGSMLYRSLIEFLGFVSDLNKSRKVWFWEVK